MMVIFIVLVVFDCLEQEKKKQTSKLLYKNKDFCGVVLPKINVKNPIRYIY